MIQATMDIHHLHEWDVDATTARALQCELAARADVTSPLECCELVAGTDISYNLGSPIMYATVIVLRLPTFEVVEVRDAVREERFPYIPGMLSFREVPALLDCFGQLETVPDVVVCDGQGIAHPLRLGLASHLGLWLDIPTLGCAKSRLCGRYEEPAEEAGSLSPLIDRDERVGSVVRMRTRVKPVFVSPGHRITLSDAERVVLSLRSGYRLPETTRLADQRVNMLRREAGHESNG